MRGRFMLENREISIASGMENDMSERLGKVCDHNPNMYAIEKSDTNIVPEKGLNNAGRTQTAAEALEGRTVTKGKH